MLIGDIYECYCEEAIYCILFKETIKVSRVTYFEKYDNMATFFGKELFEKRWLHIFAI